MRGFFPTAHLFGTDRQNWQALRTGPWDQNSEGSRVQGEACWCSGGLRTPRQETHPQHVPG